MSADKLEDNELIEEIFRRKIQDLVLDQLSDYEIEQEAELRGLIPYIEEDVNEDNSLDTIKSVVETLFYEYVEKHEIKNTRALNNLFEIVLARTI